MARDFRKALEVIATFPVTDPENKNAINMQNIAKEALRPQAEFLVGDMVKVTLGSLERTAMIKSIDANNLAAIQVKPLSDRAGFFKPGIRLSDLTHVDSL